MTTVPARTRRPTFGGSLSSISPRSALLVAAVILLGPLVVVLSQRLPLINQLDYADAWFYSAYGWVPKHHFDQFGFNYFAVRFPAILPIGLAEHALGAQYGYLILRYLLAVVTGLCLFLAVRRFATVGLSLACTMLLYLHPFFSRMILWDYSGYIMLAAAIVGFALWWWADDLQPAWSIPAGVALSAAVFANALAATAIVALVVVESVAAVRGGRTGILRLAARLAWCVFAAIAVLGLGYASYRALLGSLAPGDLLRPTINFLRSNEDQVAPYVRPPSTWLLHEARLWPPVVLSVALAAVLGRQILGRDLQAKIAQACVVYTGLLWIYRFTITSSVLETWWAYSITIVTMAPAVGVLLHALARRDRDMGRRPVWIAALATTFVGAVVLRDIPGFATNVYAPLSRHSWAIVLLLALTLLAGVALRWMRRGAGVAALVAFVLLSTFMAFAPSRLDGRAGVGMFVADGDLEWDGYAAAHEFIELIRDHNAHGLEVLLWYPGTMGLVNIAWTYLPQYGQTLQVLQSGEPVNQLTPLGTARLQEPQAHLVLIMSLRPGDVVDARAALRQAGFGTSLEERGRLAEGRLRYELVRVTRKPGA